MKAKPCNAEWSDHIYEAAVVECACGRMEVIFHVYQIFEPTSFVIVYQYIEQLNSLLLY